jgi:hypothetical protein
MTKGMATSNPLNIPDARKNIKNIPSTMSIHPNIWSALSIVVLLLYGDDDDDDDDPGFVMSYHISLLLLLLLLLLVQSSK